MKVGVLDGTLVILLVWSFDEGAALRRGGLKSSGFGCLNSALANCAFGFAGVEVDCCSSGSNSDCCEVGLSGSKVPGTLCCGVLGKSCFSGLRS